MTSRRSFLADERGFTLVAVMITMTILSLFAVGAWAAANGDMPLGRQDADRKRAYEAAEAGIQWYSYQLLHDTNYWTKCAATGDAGVNIEGSRSSWRQLPSSKAEFAVELMPVDGKTCKTADPSGTLLNNGILRVRSTGRANGKLRQIVATFRRSSFLDFLWYTKWETSPPALYSTSGSPNPGWVQTNCDQQRSTRSSSCSAIQFAPADKIDGPLHTEDDSLLVCNSPTFGGDANDKIEIARATNASTAFVPAGSCSASPNLLGTLVAPSKSLQLPNDNAAIKTVADYKYTGETCLDFNGATVTVRTGQSWGAGGQISCTGIGNTISLGADTVFYISAQSTGCTNTNLNAVDYASPATGGGAACGHVAVSGNYSTNVTIASANDIIVTSTLKKTDGTDGIMGLVASGYVRVYHPVNRSSGCVNVLPTPPPVTEIDAAILATTGSFMTDNYGCGAPLGNLTIKGAIAQYWRGPVGTGSAANPTSGYIKDYHYDRRLKYREPPQFLDPKTSNWNLLRESEQSPVLNS